MEGGEIFGAPFLKKSPLFDPYWMLPLFSRLDPDFLKTPLYGCF